MFPLRTKPVMWSSFCVWERGGGGGGGGGGGHYLEVATVGKGVQAEII